MLNDVNIEALEEAKQNIITNPSDGLAKYSVELQWQSGVQVIAKSLPMNVGGNEIQRESFTWTIDEPKELLGGATGPTPQEYLMSGLGACIIVGFAVNATAMGIKINKLKIKVNGSLDLAGFMNLRDDAQVKMDEFTFDILVDAPNTSNEQLETVKSLALNFSPNAMTIKNGVPINGTVNRMSEKKEFS